MTADSGHLWVAEHIGGTANYRVNEFDAGTGAFVSQLPQVSGISRSEFGVAVGHLAGEGQVYVGAVDPSKNEWRVVVFSEAGAVLGIWTGANAPAGPFGFDGVADVAVDNSLAGPAAGDVYVDDPVHKVVDVFAPQVAGVEPSAEHVSELTGTCPVEGTACEVAETIPFSHPSRVTVDDSTGDVLVLDSIGENLEEIQRNVIDVFEPQALGGYVFVRQITIPQVPYLFGQIPKIPYVDNIAVDGGNGEIYAAEGSEGSGVGAAVQQFSSAGVPVGRIAGEGTPTGDLRSPGAVAVDPESHRVFVGDYREAGVPTEPSAIDIYSGDLVIPDVATGPVTGVTPSGATLTGTVKLDGEGEATCLFVWGTSREFGQSAPCSKPVTEEESSVRAVLGELVPDTTYYYRLQARNKNGLNPGESSQDREFTTAGPGIHRETVSNVAAKSATFGGRIDPHGSPTTAYFQYGLSAGSYEASVPAAPGLSLGGGEGDVEVSPQHVQGLEAGTVYHYRVVVLSELEPGHPREFDGPDQTFTTQSGGGALGLPDGRSWEMVTPPEKQGALFKPILEGIVQASAAGNAIADLASQPTEAEPQGNAGLLITSVLSSRGPDGWSSQTLEPPHDEATGPAIGNGAEYRFFSEDLSLGVVQPFGGFTPLSPDASESTAYLRSDYLNGEVTDHCDASCYAPLVTAGNTPPGTAFGGESNGSKCARLICGPEFLAATPDLSHVVLRSSVALTSEPPGLYEWAGGKLKSTDGVGIEDARGIEDTRFGLHAISNDGSRIFGSGRSEGLKGLLMRDMVAGKTTLIAPTGAEYMDASSDGSKVFFLDNQKLTAESSASGWDLYEYNLDAPSGSRLVDFTDDKHVSEVAEVASVVGTSKDGTYVYYAAGGALASGAKHGECGLAARSSESATCNLYVTHGGRTTLIAGLSSSDDFPDWSLNLDGRPVRVSPDGRWLAFTSSRSLTGYDTRDAVSGRPDEEVYLYDAVNGKLVCASCNPSGARPIGVEYATIDNGLVGADRVWSKSTWIAANVPPWTRFNVGAALYQSRYLSDSGRLFFDSSDALVSQDVNGTEDVYEYEPVGIPAHSVNECEAGGASFSERSDGCVGLISAGTSVEESAFLDASETGGDVFFLTASKLVPQDFDTALDVYDAHECSVAVPCFVVPSAPPPACSTGDSCKPAPSPQPSVFGTPPSATFSGAGNLSGRSVPVVKSKALTGAQRLARALRACKQRKDAARRLACKRQAMKRYRNGRSRGKARQGGRG